MPRSDASSSTPTRARTPFPSTASNGSSKGAISPSCPDSARARHASSAGQSASGLNISRGTARTRCRCKRSASACICGWCCTSTTWFWTTRYGSLFSAWRSVPSVPAFGPWTMLSPADTPCPSRYPWKTSRSSQRAFPLDLGWTSRVMTSRAADDFSVKVLEAARFEGEPCMGFS